MSLRTIATALLATTTSTAFVAPAAPRIARSTSRAADPVGSVAFEESPRLAGYPSQLPGDYGFDPLGFCDKDVFLSSATDKARDPALIVADYRDAEIRHGRLAMLAALGWPTQELLSPSIARFFNRELEIPGLSDILTETSGRAPSVLNGGLEQSTLPLFVGVVALAIGALDLESLRQREKNGNDFVPGDYGFDPLNIAKGMSPQARFEMEEAEILNGRLAMLAITNFALAEFITGSPVIKLTPQFFTPLYEWNGVMSFLDSNFGVASEAQRLSGDAVTQWIDVQMFMNAH